MIIAIDGPAAAGKGTLGRALAERFELAYLDTGRLYRATGLAVLKSGGDPADPKAAEAAARGLDPATLGDPELRREAAGVAASKVAAQPLVRAALLDFQRHFAHHPPQGAKGAVLDGRDIGTVVCPEAPIKLFITASVEARARRRVKELLDSGQEVVESTILADLKARDARDAERDTAPMKPAEDALLIDTTELDAQAVLARVVAHVLEKRP